MTREGALDGREDGLYFYRNITAAGKYLRPGGWLLYEIGLALKVWQSVGFRMKTAGF